MGFLKYVRAQWDRTAAVVAAVVGLLALQLGWLGASGTEYLAKQIPYVISGGLLGIFLLGVATTLWLSADLRDEWRQLKALERAVRESTAGANGHSTTAPEPGRSAEGRDGRRPIRVGR